MSKLLTVNAVAEVLALAPETVYRMIRRGTLPHVRPAGRRAIRIREDAVESLIAGQAITSEKGRLRTSAP